MMELMHPSSDDMDEQSETSPLQPMTAEQVIRIVMLPKHGGFVRNAGASETVTNWYGRKG